MQGSRTIKSRPLSPPAAVLLSAAVWKMRTSGLLLTVLVVAGGAWAQYQGQQQEQEYFTCAQNEVCVYWPQCYEGVVNTGGIGILNPRSPAPIPSNITDARPCENIGKLCCVDPDKEPEPNNAVCPLHHLCVPREQCINGEINTSGIGLIDERIRPVKCSNPEYPGVDAVCCKRPDPVPLVTCPATHETCRLPSECDTASGTYDSTAVGCYLDPATGLDGVCCSPPTLPQCSRGHVCVTYEQCTEQGVVNTDGAGIFNPRIYDRCELAAGGSGICCKEPPPTNPPVVKCSQAGAVCSPTGYCQPDSLSAPQGYTETCYRTEGSGIIGECCVEAPLPECSGSYSCNVPHQCVETPGVLANNPSCQINVELVGVCCTKKEPPVPVVDVCPKDSVCLPELLCAGNPQTNVIPKACKLSGTGYSNPGVCCANNIVTPEIPDIECGVSNADLGTRIKNTNLLERQTKFAEFPWMAVVFFRNQTYKCGASLVDNRWVLTAAHCVAGYNPYDLRVRLGEYQVDLFDEQYPYEDYDIASITVHPKFNSANLHNDVAVLELDRPVVYRYHINRICLPPPDRIHTAGTECIATGWGKDAFDGGKYQVIMKKVVLPVVPSETCQDMLRKTRLGLFFILDKSFVCAGGKADQDACTGDGGGPLMCLNPGSGRYELYGMTAWGIGCGIEGNPGVYVNVPYFMEWVYGIMQPTQEQQQQHSAGPYGK